MINTVSIKSEQLKNGFFKSGSGPTKILIMGSCRVAPYANYLEQYNEQNDNKFTIYSLDPFNLHWNEKDERVDYEQALLFQETNQSLLDMLSSVDIFISEYYANAGMFNIERNKPKMIYHYGLKPQIEIFIPNFNDLFILAGDIVSFDMNIRKMATQDMNVIGKLSEQTIKEINSVRDKNLDKFYNICEKTSFPEFAEVFKENYKSIRYFFNSNHISKKFTLDLFWLVMKKINATVSYSFWESIEKYDMFDSHYTRITEYDNVNWQEEIKPLREFL